MSNTNFDKVREFHSAFGMPDIGTQVNVPPDRVKLRLDLIVEELDELFESTNGTPRGTVSSLIWDGLTKRGSEYPICNSNNEVAIFSRVGTADALVDLLYVVYGACLEFGIDANKVFDEVHRSNMSKLGEDGQPIYREDGKVLKGPNFFEPNIEKAMNRG